MILVAQANSCIVHATPFLMPTPSQVNLAKLSATLRTKRGDKGLRAVAEEIGGVSASTLSRIEQGNVPDLDTFMKICRWLGVPPDEFGSQGQQAKFAAGVAASERAKRLSAAKSRLTEIDARIVVETLATLLMPEASIFWDEAERQVELIGSRFEVIVRESPNAPREPRREGGGE